MTKTNSKSDNNMREREREGTTQSMLVGLFARFSEFYKSIPFPMMDRPLGVERNFVKKEEEEEEKTDFARRHRRGHDNRVSSLASSFRRKHPTRSPSTGEAGGTRTSGYHLHQDLHQVVSTIQVGFPFLFYQPTKSPLIFYCLVTTFAIPYFSLIFIIVVFGNTNRRDKMRIDK
uniref:Transmembrane protein n=1 Tax=Daphnia galeata TaxID=27404 RepID=A0A8J2WJZ3_9CRUS|nr:unnamed protein product [Daphnia galeata]